MASFLHSRGWKKFIAKLYGIGAALVIVGALFKLEHWPGATYMLSVGMLTEFVIFLFSAFDPLPKEYGWENVYPELLEEGGEGSGGDSGSGGRARIAGGDLNIDPSMADGLKDSVGKFSKAVNSLNALTTIANASNTFVGGIEQAAGNMAVLNQSMQDLNAAYGYAAQTVNTGGQQTHANVETLNKHLAAVNASYELYIQEHQQYTASSRQLVSAMNQSAQQSQQFTAQMGLLTNNIGELNNIYGSMLSAVNAALKR
ncbi:MAG: gliding motility protein GldL [Prevotellaceae bacterium]|jgi:gliding motility-associated protein GldL|nr:gliding motility protein GldL [Prevotellaceae bacterium]